MKSPIKIALFAALPLELLIFFLGAFPIDVGLPDNAPWYRSSMAVLWVYIHYPALRLALFGQSFFPFVWLLIGYLDCVLLLIAGIYICVGFRRLGRRLSGDPNQPA
jgi:hypothetical protein